MTDTLTQKLRQLKLPSMADALLRQRETPQTYDELSFAERLELLLDDELLSRENRQVAWLIKNANLKYQAAPEGLHYPISRGLKVEQMRELLNGHYISHRKTSSSPARQEAVKPGSPMFLANRPVARNTRSSTDVPVACSKRWLRDGWMAAGLSNSGCCRKQRC